MVVGDTGPAPEVAPMGPTEVAETIVYRETTVVELPPGRGDTGGLFRRDMVRKTPNDPWVLPGMSRTSFLHLGVHVHLLT